MEKVYQSTNYGGDAPGNYQKFFVPSIGAPIATDLLAIAKLKPGDRVLDVACGTGVVTRLAAERVAPAGRVTGVDLNAGMIQIARVSTQAELAIEWVEADAERMPLEDGAFDVALCQMGLQFMANKLAALREMHRVLAPGGRVHVNVPGPKPRLFAIMGEALAHHVTPDGATFTDLVFSMHDPDELRHLFRDSGFRDVEITSAPKRLTVPPPQEFLWQYIHSTPLAQAAARADDRTRDQLEREVYPRWAEFVVDGRIRFDVGMTTVSAVR